MQTYKIYIKNTLSYAYNNPVIYIATNNYNNVKRILRKTTYTLAVLLQTCPNTKQNIFIWELLLPIVPSYL